MWLEVKGLFTIISCIFMGIAVGQILLVGMTIGADFSFLIFMLFASLFLWIFSDILIGWKIVSTHAKYVMDKPPPGKVVIPLITLTGLLDFVWADKRPYGKREFVYNKQEASLIDRGDYPIHMLNGGHGCIGHESCDENINMFEVKYAEKLHDMTGSDNLKEAYHIVKDKEKKRVNSYE